MLGYSACEAIVTDTFFMLRNFEARNGFLASGDLLLGKVVSVRKDVVGEIFDHE